jgi:hypothetical protein
VFVLSSHFNHQMENVGTIILAYNNVVIIFTIKSLYNRCECKLVCLPLQVILAVTNAQAYNSSICTFALKDLSNRSCENSRKCQKTEQRKKRKNRCKFRISKSLKLFVGVLSKFLDNNSYLIETVMYTYREPTCTAKDIACISSSEVGLLSVKGQNLECFK